MGFSDYLAWLFWAFIWISFICVVIFILFDLFSDHALSGWGKAGWVILICLFPALGALIYLIARGKGMAERRAYGREEVREDDDYKPRRFDNPADEISKAKALADQGIISQGEYEAIKDKALRATG